MGGAGSGLLGAAEVCLVRNRLRRYLSLVHTNEKKCQVLRRLCAVFGRCVGVGSADLVVLNMVAAGLRNWSSVAGRLLFCLGWGKKS